MTAEDVKTLAEWLGDTREAVSDAEAERRSGICVGCPLNLNSSSWFKVGMESVRKWVSVRDGLGMRTSQEGKLGVCRGCGCWLPLKVHVSYTFIKEHQRDEVATVIRTVKPECWQL